MKISLDWMNQYIDVSEFFDKPEELDRILTSAGLEVENMQNLKKDYEHVVVGQVVELGRHPDADRLTLCQVDTGASELQQIVCGATNHKQGDYVVVATPGAVLPGDFKIKKSKIRGVESLGMLCSEVELGMASESDGIMILPETKVGVPFADYYGLNDIIFDLGVTPNRADCLSHIGLARELSCLLDRPLKFPKHEVKTAEAGTEKEIQLNLRETELCPRYSGRRVLNVKVQESPNWLKRRLEALGLNSINNIVDVTNFVMMELGQPLHAFDVSEVQGSTITIDKSKAGESFQTLDGSELKLTGEELVIRDQSRPVALAGVVGGLNSGVTEKTMNIFVESAHFVPSTVRRTARKFGIDTDSAYRFSRGTDPEMVVKALDRACLLIQEVAGGEVCESYHDQYPQPRVPAEIELTHEYLEERLGYQVEFSTFSDWMKRLGCEVTSSSSSAKVKTPSFRWDLAIPEDLIEEFARLYGYDKIPEVLPPLRGEPSAHDARYLNSRRLNQFFVEQGYMQAINYAFVSGADQSAKLPSLEQWSQSGLGITGEPVMVRNPLSEDFNTMRVSLLPGLLESAVNAYRHGSHSGRLFELGAVFERKSNGIEEPERVSAIHWGSFEGLWNKEKSSPVVYELKGAIENILSRLGATGYQWRAVKKEDIPELMHPGQCTSLFYEGKCIGLLGTVHPSVLESYKVRHQVAICEFDADRLMSRQPRKPKLKTLSKFPVVQRDFSFVVSKSSSSADIVKEIRKSGGNLIQDVAVLDLFEGGDIASGQQSLTFRIYCQSEKETLSEDVLSNLQQKILKSVSQKFQV